MPNERTTWLITSVRDGSAPSADDDERRRHRHERGARTIGICRRMKPCITTWPASVPTAELESPEKRSAIAKSALDAPPSSGSSVLCAPSSESTS